MSRLLKDSSIDCAASAPSSLPQYTDIEERLSPSAFNICRSPSLEKISLKFQHTQQQQHLSNIVELSSKRNILLTRSSELVQILSELTIIRTEEIKYKTTNENNASEDYIRLLIERIISKYPSLRSTLKSKSRGLDNAIAMTREEISKTLISLSDIREKISNEYHSLNEIEVGFTTTEEAIRSAYMQIPNV